MTPHYYDENPTGLIREESFFVIINKIHYPFIAASGLFSKKHLDSATKLLLEKCDVSSAKKILDLGCGWGAVGVVLASQYPDKEIIASDINSRAIEYTKKNALKNNVKLQVIKSDILKSFPNETFDCILTNPPYVAGRKVCFQFIDDSFTHLNQGGSLQLVARHNKGGKTLGLHMEELFGNCEHVAKQGGFRIYKSIKE